MPITLFCIHGNHERRPSTLECYNLQKWHGGSVYYEEAYPNIIFAQDGEIYNIGGYRTVAIGGAYSIDKFFRIKMLAAWFSDEQPSAEIKRYVEQKLEESAWNVDAVLTHTCPISKEPIELFLSGVNQTRVDKSTKEWLETIKEKLHFKRWYYGYYHGDIDYGDFKLMYKEIQEFMAD